MMTTKSTVNWSKRNLKWAIRCNETLEEENGDWLEEKDESGLRGNRCGFEEDTCSSISD